MKSSPTGFNYPLDTHKINQPWKKKEAREERKELPQVSLTFTCGSLCLVKGLLVLLLAFAWTRRLLPAALSLAHFGSDVALTRKHEFRLGIAPQIWGAAR